MHERASDAPSLLSADDLVDWLPDETVYSLASRYHVLSGAARPEITAQRLFGQRRAGFPHDIPGGIGYFASAFAGRLGSVSQVALDRTILPLLIAFRSDAQRQDAMTAVAEQSIKGLKSRLGLPASGFGASYPLKACDACMANDQLEYGTAYWHRSHQFPGIWVCLKHQKELLVSCSKRAGQNRFGWTLPAEGDLIHPSASNARTGLSSDLGRSELLLKFATASISAAAAGRTSAGRHGDAGKAIVSRLVELGLASPEGRMRMRPLIADLRQAMMPVSNIPEFAAIAYSDGAAQSQIYRILSDPSNGGHPLRYLSMIVWLFDSWKSFEDRRSNIPDPTLCAKPVDKPVLRPVASQKRDQVIRWICREGISMASAARRAGVQVATVQAWAASDGIQAPKRPSKLKGALGEELLANLRTGMEKVQAAKLAGVSVSSVNRTLRTSVDLHRTWQAARHDRAQTQARTVWTEALSVCRHLGPGKARQLAPAAYAWLHRNDYGWLQSSIVATPKNRRSNNASVDWILRDRALRTNVEAAVTEILVKEPLRRCISMTDIFKLVPELKSKLRHGDLLPLTIQSLKRAVGTKCRPRFY